MRAASKIPQSAPTVSFTESVIHEMTRLAMEHAINLAQGFPDFPAPAEAKQAAQGRDRRGSQPVSDHVG